MSKSNPDDLINIEFVELQSKFQALAIEKNSSSGYTIFGRLSFKTQYKGLDIDEAFIVDISVPLDYPNSLPTVREVNHRIPPDFHTYPSGDLCLGVLIDLRIKFSRIPTLLGFVELCVIPYFCAFIHWQQTGIRPAGELDHGANGIIQYYLNHLNCDLKSLYLLFSVINNNKYIGHQTCPCDSGLKLRKCHGQKLLEIKKLMSKTELDDEFNFIYLAVVEYLEKQSQKQPQRVIPMLL